MTRILWALSENIEIMTLIAMVLRLRIGVEKISSNGDRELTRLAPTPPVEETHAKRVGDCLGYT